MLAVVKHDRMLTRTVPEVPHKSHASHSIPFILLWPLSCIDT